MSKVKKELEDIWFFASDNNITLSPGCISSQLDIDHYDLRGICVLRSPQL